MGDIKNTIFKNPLPYLVQASSLVMLVIALYITARLSPVIQDLAVLKNQVQANETQIGLMVKPITDRLDRIEIKLDRLIEK